MKNVFRTLLLFTSLNLITGLAYAIETCRSMSCSPEQMSVESKFNSFINENKLHQDKVYSGVCYHTGFSVSSSEPHSSLFVLSKSHDKNYANFIFGFFVPFSHYSQLDLQSAQTYLQNSGGAPRELTNSSEDFQFTLQFETGNIQYRMKVLEDKIYLIGIWRFDRFSASNFCEYQANPNQ